jgi:hypothetical protein
MMNEEKHAASNSSFIILRSSFVLIGGLSKG